MSEDEIPLTDERPWGSYRILESSKHMQVKIITVNPNSRLSLQRHIYRSERWYILDGTPTITIGDNEFTARAGDEFYIPVNELHRIAAGEQQVRFVEIQSGTYYGEDDIIRLEDDYGR